MDSDVEICIPPKLHLSSESIDRHGVYILDNCENIYMWVGRSVHDQFLQDVFGVKTFNELPDHMVSIFIWLFIWSLIYCLNWTIVRTARTRKHAIRKDTQFYYVFIRSKTFWNFVYLSEVILCFFFNDLVLCFFFFAILFFREDSKKRAMFFQNFHEDKTESSLSYQEFTRHVLDQVKK